MIPETREEYEAAMQSRARTVCLTMEQIREWNLAVEAVPMSEESAVAAIFGTDQQFYEAVLEEEAGREPSGERARAGPGACAGRVRPMRRRVPPRSRGFGRIGATGSRVT